MAEDNAGEVLRRVLRDIQLMPTASEVGAISRLKAERDENTCRKDMTPSELVAIGKKLEELKRPEAERRQAEGQRLGGQIRQGSASWPIDQEAEPSKGTRAEVAEAVGMTESTYKRAKRVVEASEDESAPEPPAVGPVEGDPAGRAGDGAPR